MSISSLIATLPARRIHLSGGASVLSALFAALVLSSGCGSSATPNNGAAVVTLGPCSLQSDCDMGGYCDANLKQCVQQCDETKGLLCPNGQVCKNKMCVGFSSDAGTLDAAGSSDAGSADGGGGGGDGSGSGGDSSSVKDTAPPAPKDKSCGKCTTNSDCGDGLECIVLVSGNYCAKKCSTVSECTPGYVCEKASASEQKYCVLPTYDCKGCAVDGCPSGQTCNFKANPPACLETKKTCDACLQDKDCDNGLRCVKFGDAKACVPDCSAGQACPDNSTCVAYVTEATKACAFAANKCCYGAACSSGCSGCSGTCVAGKCLQCTKNADCPGGSCNLTTYTCVNGSTCPPAGAPQKKIKKSATGECVECTNDTHCAGSSGGPKCNIQTNTCEKSSASNECAVCGGDYPGCIDINGTWTCVECTTDDDCAKKSKGTCSSKTYTCSGSGGGGIIGPKTGTCKSDADCPADPNGTFDLACDAASGLCYDKAGKCDNVVAFCNAAAGSVCELSGDLLGGGGLPGGLPGGVPGLPGGGQAPAPSVGSCSCGTGGGSSGGGAGSGYTYNPICDQLKAFVPNLAKCDCAKDPNSPDCGISIPIPLPIPGIPTNCCTAPSGGGSGGSGGGSGGGGTGLPLDCLLGGVGGSGGTSDPMCFGGIKCSTNILKCFSGQKGSSCGGGGMGLP